MFSASQDILTQLQSDTTRGCAWPGVFEGNLWGGGGGQGLGMATVVLVQEPQQGQSQQGWALPPTCPLLPAVPFSVGAPQSSGRKSRSSCWPGTAPAANLGWVTEVIQDVSQPERRDRIPLLFLADAAELCPCASLPRKAQPIPKPCPALLACSGRAEFPSWPSVLPVLMETLGPQPSVAERGWNGDRLILFQV